MKIKTPVPNRQINWKFPANQFHNIRKNKNEQKTTNVGQIALERQTGKISLKGLLLKFLCSFKKTDLQIRNL